MKWQEVIVATSNEAQAAVNNLLMTAGATGIQIDDQTQPIKLHGFFPADVDINQVADQLQKEVAALQQYGLNPLPAKVFPHAITDNSWQTTWEKYYHPTRISRYLTIVPRWEAYTPQNDDEHIIKLDPGRAFGTGTHPTTILTIHALETAIRGNETMYDVGTGSGVLSIAGKWLGVKAIQAFDVDQVAVDSALVNLKMNKVSQNVQVRVNNLLDNITQPVDVVVANMLPEVLIPLIPQAEQCLPINGKLILGGIIKDKLTLIKHHLRAHHFRVEEEYAMKDWRSLIALKDGE